MGHVTKKTLNFNSEKLSNLLVEELGADVLPWAAVAPWNCMHQAIISSAYPLLHHDLRSKFVDQDTNVWESILAMSIHQQRFAFPFLPLHILVLACAATSLWELGHEDVVTGQDSSILPRPQIHEVLGFWEFVRLLEEAVFHTHHRLIKLTFKHVNWSSMTRHHHGSDYSVCVKFWHCVCPNSLSHFSQGTARFFTQSVSLVGNINHWQLQ